MRGLIVGLVLAVTRWRWVRRLFTETRVGRRVALRFVAGETLDQAVEATRRLNQEGMSVSLDHLGEHVEDEESARTARDAYLACLERIAADGLDANISVKLTHLGMGRDDDLAAASLDALAARAGKLGLTVTIDMEDSAHTETTLRLYEKAQRAHGNLGVAVQAYLRRTPEDLERLASLGARTWRGGMGVERSGTLIAWGRSCRWRGERSEMTHFTLSASCLATTACPL